MRAPIDPRAPFYVQVTPGQDLPALPVQAAFRAVIVADAAVSAEHQSSVCDWLVGAGCLYAMSWGINASAWDDAMDMANLACFGFGDVPPQAFVMTTWHDEESLSEVFDFAIRCANHPVEPLDELIVVHVAEQPAEERLQQAFSDGLQIAEAAMSSRST